MTTAEDVQTLRDTLRRSHHLSSFVAGSPAESRRVAAEGEADDAALDRLVAELQRLQDENTELVLQNEACGNALVDTEARLQAAEHALRRIAQADLDPHERPAESDWTPSFFAWAPGVARAALAAAAAPSGET
jgi:hypothetical protein